MKSSGTMLSFTEALDLNLQDPLKLSSAITNDFQEFKWIV